MSKTDSVKLKFPWVKLQWCIKARATGTIEAVTVDDCVKAWKLYYGELVGLPAEDERRPMRDQQLVLLVN